MSGPPPAEVIYVVRNPYRSDGWYASDYAAVSVVGCVLLICALLCLGETYTERRRYVAYQQPQHAASRERLRYDDC